MTTELAPECPRACVEFVEELRMLARKRERSAKRTKGAIELVERSHERAWITWDAVAILSRAWGVP